MILSASRRCDIPCYFGEWFLNRLKAGYVLTRNPFNNAQLSKIPVTPDVVDCIVFWTKDPKNIMPYLTTIDKMGYKYYFQFTLTPYDKHLEQNLRDKSEIENTFIELSGQIGRDKVLWRYDPIVLNEKLDIDYHKQHFERLCAKLSPYTKNVTISFVDLYSKQKKSPVKSITAENSPFSSEDNLLREITQDEILKLSEFIGKTAKKYGLTAKACAEKDDLTPFGIEKGCCIDKTVIEKICDCALDVKNDKNQRAGCGCMESIDIGAYNICPNGCIYCYANAGFSTTQKRYQSHNPQSDLLIGSVREGEKIIKRNVKSNKQAQIKLF